MYWIDSVAKKITSYCTIIMVATLLSACGSEEEADTESLEIRLITAETIIREGNTFQLGVFNKVTGTQDLSAKISDTNQSFESDEYVWTINTATAANITNVLGYKNTLVTLEPGVIALTATNSKNTLRLSVTIAPALLERINITLASSIIDQEDQLRFSAAGQYSMYQGGELTFLVTGEYSDNSSRLITDNITWEVEQTDLASVNAEGIVKAIIVGVTDLNAATTNEFGDTIDTSVDFTVTPKAVEELSISAAVNIPLGRELPIEVLARYTNQSTKLITEGVTWTTSQAGIVNITDNGMIETLAEGEVAITASIDSGYGEDITANTIMLLISAPVLESLTIKPVNPTIDIETPVISIEKSEYFIVEATSSIGVIEDVTSRAALKISNSHDEFASLSYNETEGKFLFQTFKEGETTVEVTLANRLEEPLSFSREISVITPVLQSIVISPLQPSFAIGQHTYWQATGKFDDNTLVDISNQVSWISSEISRATFNDTSLSNRMFVNEAGRVSIIASMTNGLGQVIESLPEVITLLPAKVMSVKLVLDNLDITEQSLSLPQGVSNDFQLIGVYSDGSEKTLSGVNWASDSELLAEIIEGSVTANKEIGVLGLFTLTAGIVIDGSEFNSTVDILVTPAKLLSLSISLPDFDELGLWAGYSQTLKATGFFSDGRERTLTDVVQWSVDNAYISKMTLSSTVANTLDFSNAGAVVIQANYVDIYDNSETKSGEFAFTIKPALLTALTLNAKIDLDKDGVGEEDVTAIASGFKALFYAQGYYSDGTSLAITSDVIWTSSATSYLTITDTGEEGGKADALAPTSDDTGLIINAVIDNAAGKSITNSINFSVDNAVLESINLSPQAQSVGLNVPAGKSVQLEIWGTYSDGAYKMLAGEYVADWESTETSIGEVSADTGLVTMLAGEPTSLVITAIEKISGNNIKGSVNLNRIDKVVDSIRIEPDTGIEAWKLALGAQLQLQGYAVYSDSSEVELTLNEESNWSIPNTDHQQFISVNPVLKGSITAKKINDNILTVQLTNSGFNNNEVFTTTADFVIGEPIIEFIEISPNSQTIVSGDSLIYTAKAFDSNDNVIDITGADNLNWTVVDSTIADFNFNQTGVNVLTSLAVGATYVEASYTPSGQAEITTTSLLTVAPAVLRLIVIEPEQARFIPTTDSVTERTPLFLKGDIDKLSAKGYYSDGSIVDISDEVTWSSSQPEIAQVSSIYPLPGMLTPLALGQAIIYCEMRIEELGQNKTIATEYPIEVGAPLLEFIEITPTSPIFVKDMKKAFVAKGIYSDNSIQDLTNSVAWSTGRVGEEVIDKAGSINNTEPNKGAFTAERIGTTSVNASLINFDGDNVLKQTLATVKTLGRIEVTRTAGTIYAGNKVYVMAKAYSSVNDEMLFTQGLTWTVSSLATFDDINISQSENILTSVAEGTVNVTASWDIKDDGGTVTGIATDTLAITVDAPLLTSLVLSSSDTAIPRGTNAQLSATATYSDGSSAVINAAVQWSNTNNDFVTINETTGEIFAANTGEASLVAYFTNAEDELITSNLLAITVEPPVLESLSAVLSDSTIPRGTNAIITVIGRLSDGTNGLPENISVTIVSSDSVNAPIVNSVVSVQPTATLNNELTFTISAPQKNGAAELISTNISAFVADPLLVGMTIEAPNAVISRGNSTGLTLSALRSDNTLGLPTGVVASWQSANNAIANVDENTGVVTIPNNAPIGENVVITLTAPAENGSSSIVTQTITLTVGEPVVERIDITTANSSVRKGRSITPAYNVQMSDDNSASVPTLTWSSSNELIVKVNPTTGIITIPATASVGSIATVTLSAAELPGSSIIISDSFDVTVTAAALESISLSPGNSIVPRGTALTLNATGMLSDGANGIPTALTWTSADTAKAGVNDGVVSIPNNAVVGATVTITVSAADAVINSVTTITETITITVGEPLVESITITNGDVMVARGLGLQLNSSIVMSDASSGPTLTWTSNTPSLITVDSNGYIQVGNSAYVTSNVIITASTLVHTGASRSIDATITITVGAPVLTALTIPSGDVSVRRGESLTLDVVGLLSDGSNGIPSQETWSVNGSTHATITAETGELTVVNGATLNATVVVTVSAAESIGSSTAIERSIAITVIEPRAQSIDITVTDVPQSTVSVVKGGSVQLGSSIIMSDGAVTSSETRTWEAVSPKLTVDTNGLVALQGGAKEGDTYIITVAMPTYSDSLDTVTDAIELIVTKEILSSIILSPVSSTSPQNAEPSYLSTNGSVVMAVASGLMTDGSVASPDILATGLQWASSNTNVATVNEATGAVLIIATSGTSTITGTIAVAGNPTITNAITLTAIPPILDSITLSSGDISIPNGLTLGVNVSSGLLTNGVYATDLATGLTWASSNDEIATVDESSGLVTVLTNATENVTATITATMTVAGFDDVSASFVVTAIAPVLQTIVISPTDRNIANGDTLALSVTSGTLSDGTVASQTVLSTGLSWSSSGAAATVDTDTGVVTANASSGDERVTASIVVLGYPDGTTEITDTVTITAISAILASIDLSSDDISLPNGLTLDVNVDSGLLTDNTAAFTSGLTLTWSSSNTAVATVNPEGIVTVIDATGSSVITATFAVTDGDDVSASFVVTAAPAQLRVTLTSADQPLALGTVQSFTPVFTMTDNSPAPALSASDLTWLSDDNVIATVDTGGVVSTLKEGNVTISATLTDAAGQYAYDVSDTVVVDVSAKTIVDFKLYAESSSTLAEQLSLRVHPIAIYSDQTTAPYTAHLDWSSSDTDHIKIAGEVASSPHVDQSTPVTISSFDLSADVLTTITVADNDASFGNKTLAVKFIDAAVTTTSVEASVDVVTLPIDIDYPLSAVAILSDNTVQELNTNSGVAWADNDAGGVSDVTVEEAGGLVTIASAPTLDTDITATITATYDTKTATAALIIKSGAILYSIEIIPGDITLALGVKHNLTALGTYQYGATSNVKYLVVDISDKVTWTVTDNALATEASSQLLGVSVGATTITATLSNLTDTADITDTANLTVVEQITSISTIPTALVLSNDSSLQAQVYPIKAYANYANDDGEVYQHDITEHVYWNATDQLTVSNIAGKKGEITPISFSGVPIVTATLFTEKGTVVNDSLAVTFPTRTLTSLAISPSTITLDNDDKQSFTATLTYSDTSTNVVTELVTWSIDNAADAFVNNVAGQRGQVSGVGSSTATITVTAKLPGSLCSSVLCTSTATITRQDESATALTITSDTATVAVDATLQFNVTGTFDTDGEVDLTEDVVWSTSDPSKATISNKLGSKGLLTRMTSGDITVTATYKNINDDSGDISSSSP